MNVMPEVTSEFQMRPLSLETPLSVSFQFRQLICELSKIRQEVKNKLGFE
jgi:hypothetical protein